MTTITVPDFIWEAALRNRLSLLTEETQSEAQPEYTVSGLPMVGFGMSSQLLERESITFQFPSSTGLDYREGQAQDERTILLVSIVLKKRIGRDIAKTKDTVATVVYLVKGLLLGFQLPPPAISELRHEETTKNLYQGDRGLWGAEIQFSFNSRIHPINPDPKEIPEILHIIHDDELGTLADLNG